jgi:hypothetical protein
MSELSHLVELARKRAIREGMRDQHNPKNVVAALLVEACQLASGFQWLSPRDSIVLAYQDSSRDRVATQMAEVLYLLLRLADELGVDLGSATLQRLRQAGEAADRQE